MVVMPILLNDEWHNVLSFRVSYLSTQEPPELKYVLYCETNFCTPVTKKSTVRERNQSVRIDYLPMDATANADRHCTTQESLLQAIQNRRLEMLHDGIVLLRKNTHYHAALHTQQLRQKFRWVVYYHSAYSPDLTSSDYHLFQHLKSFLGE
ncbi:hypothetical protein AVEN_125457-1 [Araneus ventricosus]|uniref:Mariner Mos1 transposase n=1 Tax=Araneus ventricosus TaxID=182803 RepID=A0A4Y2H8X0_ARAVE|nr:hypothetical protein AVEN_125457-1 [Araneus ventricosus]